MNPWIDMQPGIRRRTLASSAALMQVLVEFAPGSVIPEHAHSNEQMTHVLSGKLTLTVGDTTHECVPGDTLLIPSHIPHSAKSTEATRVLDTFSPPRPDMLAQDNAQRKEENTPHA